MKQTLIFAGMAAAFLALGGPVSAHHANSAYDRSQTISISGTVTKWQFINPHAGLWLNVTDEQGNVQEWSAEFQGVLDLYRHFSWNKDTFKAGDVVTIMGNPSRNGDLNLATVEVTFGDGRKVNVRNAPD